MKRSKHGLFVFPQKTPNMEKASFDWPIVLQYEVKAKYRLISRKLFGHEVFSAERSLHQPKARRVCIRSTNQSNRFIFVRLLSYENRSNCLRPARRGPGKAKWESCLPKGQAGIQVFLSPDFVTFFTILITWPNIKLNYSCLFMLLTLIIASYLVLRCMDYCQRFQKNVMRYAATLRDWNVTLYINFGDVNLTMFFFWLSL